MIRALSAASEAYPLIKTGGLADVVGALPGALAPHDVQVTTLVPGYPAVLSALKKVKRVHKYDALLGAPAQLLATQLEGHPLLVLDAPTLFDRVGGPYGDARGKDWADNWRRFAAFGRAAADLASGVVTGQRFDILHAHDWQAAMAPAYLRYAPGPGPRGASLITIHNIAFQGRFDQTVFKSLELPPRAYAIDGIEYYGGVGFLKAGLASADAITTVSPGYAAEIRQAQFGMGLEGLIQARAGAVSGIVNGIDRAIWDPAHDKLLATPYDADSIAKRVASKRDVEAIFALKPGHGPLFTVISRLTWQKGMDVLARQLDALVAMGGRLALLGTGDAGLEAEFRAAAVRHPGHIGVEMAYDEKLSHLLQGGADAILIPSRFEPCGLTQLYGLAYGCVPVAARTGGLSDTIIDANEAALSAGVATGILFNDVTADGLARALERTMQLFAQPDVWAGLQRQGMKADFSWQRSGAHYAGLYKSLLPQPAAPREEAVTPLLGARYEPTQIVFSVRAQDAELVNLCLFDGPRETRLAMTRQGDLHSVTVPGIKPGQAYGLRASGPWNPEHGLCFDESKLLTDPYATRLDRQFVYDPRLAAHGIDTAALVPKALVTAPFVPVPHRKPCFTPGGLIYEINVRGFTQRHPDVPPNLRGTIAALGHPTILAHLHKLRVSAVELMPITAWIDERHLPPLGLRNAWGYNPVVPMALDPGLAPGGIAELRETALALQAAGIGVILDLVLNHTGESDAAGPTLSLRGLDRRYYTREPDGSLSNITGTGNTLNCAEPMVRELMLDTLRHFVTQAGIDGFRFDLAPILAREPGFNPQAPIFTEIAADPVLADRILIAEPWDIGPGGYQLGQFPPNWLEWNDRYRDDVRRFWRGDPGTAGALATRMAGSSDIFTGAASRSVNFIAAHDGFTLADIAAYRERHNEANGEDNRDGHGENFSWNNGAEGASHDPTIAARRAADVRALLSTLFASKGAMLVTAGDEFGRSQQGNNNAYAQDNEITWLDWDGRDRDLEDFVAALAAFRAGNPLLGDPDFLKTADWRDLDGHPMTPEKWEAQDAPGFEVRLPHGVALRTDRTHRQCNAWNAK